MSARTLATQAISSCFLKAARPHGYRKDALTFRRRSGETIHVINFQFSHGNSESEAKFYVNIGIAFDRLWALSGQPTTEKPREVECCFRRRLEQVNPSASPHWDATEQTDPSLMAVNLAQCLEPVLDDMLAVDSITSFLALNWLGTGSDLGLRARMLYVEGDLPGAARYVEEEAAFFRDRQGCSIPRLIRRYKMPALAPFFRAESS